MFALNYTFLPPKHNPHRHHQHHCSHLSASSAIFNKICTKAMQKEEKKKKKKANDTQKHLKFLFRLVNNSCGICDLEGWTVTMFAVYLFWWSALTAPAAEVPRTVPQKSIHLKSHVYLRKSPWRHLLSSHAAVRTLLYTFHPLTQDRRRISWENAKMLCCIPCLISAISLIT